MTVNRPHGGFKNLQKSYFYVVYHQLYFYPSFNCYYYEHVCEPSDPLI